MTRGKRLVLTVLWATLVAACGGNPGTRPQSPSSGPELVEPVSPSVPVASVTSGGRLEPDPNADFTLGDTAELSGGEFVGDQASLTVEDATVLSDPAVKGEMRFAFLVSITGRDPETFPYNLRDFRLIDDEDFQYEPLNDGGQEPRLEFGDLPPGERVRGWLTFEAPATTTTVELVYSPALALDPASFGFLVTV